jgi:hypothetical protein
VRAARHNGRVVVEVSDDGVGSADPTKGSGLNGLADAFPPSTASSRYEANADRAPCSGRRFPTDRPAAPSPRSCNGRRVASATRPHPTRIARPTPQRHLSRASRPPRSMRAVGRTRSVSYGKGRLRGGVASARLGRAAGPQIETTASSQKEQPRAPGPHCWALPARTRTGSGSPTSPLPVGFRVPTSCGPGPWGAAGVDGVDDLGAVDALEVDRGDAEVVCPSWRWITISGTPSRAISTACACRSWCGANRRA